MATRALKIIAGYHQENLCGHESSLKNVDSWKQTPSKVFLTNLLLVGLPSELIWRYHKTGYLAYVLCHKGVDVWGWGESLDDTEPFQISMGQSQCLQSGDCGTLGARKKEKKEKMRRSCCTPGKPTLSLGQHCWFFFFIFLHMRM